MHPEWHKRKQVPRLQSTHIHNLGILCARCSATLQGSEAQAHAFQARIENKRTKIKDIITLDRVAQRFFYDACAHHVRSRIFSIHTTPSCALAFRWFTLSIFRIWNPYSKTYVCVFCSFIFYKSNIYNDVGEHHRNSIIYKYATSFTYTHHTQGLHMMHSTDRVHGYNPACLASPFSTLNHSTTLYVILPPSRSLWVNGVCATMRLAG